MKKHLLTLLVCWLGYGLAFAQTTVATNHTATNGNGSVTFEVENTNAYDIVITDVACHFDFADEQYVQLLYNTTPINQPGPGWTGGTVGAGQNGWQLAGSATLFNTDNGDGVVPAISGMSLIIPAGATYGMAFSGVSIRYMDLSAAVVNTFAGDGVEIHTGTAISWGGPSYPATPGNYPRGFIGSITFVEAVACTAPPTAGDAEASVTEICPATNFQVTIPSAAGVTGQTYQWQSSPDDISYTNIPTATGMNYTAQISEGTYFRAIVTCSGQSDTTTPVFVDVSPFMDCYCESYANNTIDEEIYSVTVNGASTDPVYADDNGCDEEAPGPGSMLSQYSNFLTLPALTSLNPGQEVDFVVEQDECDGPDYYAAGIGVWIDFNQNGSFNDPGEAVYIDVETVISPRTAEGSFTVPANAVPGNTVMRVICAEGYAGPDLDPCLIYGYGETEDHLINIACPDLAPLVADEGVCSGNDAEITVVPTEDLSTISWWDSPVGGSQIASGASYTITNVTVNSTVYVQEDFTGCPSSARIEVNVIVSDVDVVLEPIAATCNGLADGSFEQTDDLCGLAPFTYSVDGGAFGAIPTNLAAGVHEVIVRDANSDESVPYMVIISEPSAPTDLDVTDIGYNVATLSWTAQGSETDWVVEYGPEGFTPGSGITIPDATNPQVIDGLDPATEYDFYVAAGCVPGSAVAGPYSFTTREPILTYDNNCGPGFIDISGTGEALNLNDGDAVFVTAGFPLTYQGENTDQVYVSENGWISFGNVGLDVYSQDFDGGEGNVYHETVNVGGENLFIVQWDNRRHWMGVAGQTVTFEVIINETTGEIFYIYEDAVFGGTQDWADNGLDAYIGAAGDQQQFIVSEYDDEYLLANSCIRFYTALCPNPTNIEVVTFSEEAQVTWEASAYGETNWTVIFGPAGFDPATSGTTQTTTDPEIQLAPLTEGTEYDVYIYSDCQLDSLMSDGTMTTFTTVPYCSNPTDLSGDTYEDSLDVSWDWEVNMEQPSVEVTGFNIQYGELGFELGSGTTVPADGLNFADTVANPDLIAGGVYQIYVQAVCDTYSSAFSGPITVVMPLTNDDPCGAEMLQADGTLYTLNNGGATVAPGENAIAPPVTGAQTTTGWANAALNNTTWFTFVAPASGSVRVNNTAIGYNGQAAIYSASDCANYGSFFRLAANDNEIGGTSVAPNFTICGLNPGQTYYLLHDGFNAATGNYAISITPIVLEAGLAGETANICSGSEVDLFTTISGYGAGGVWSSADGIAAVNASIDGSQFTSEGLAYQVFNIEYRVSDGCAYDSVIAEVHVFAPSNAGEDGSITACRNEPIDLLAGLNGSADLNGTWYDPSQDELPNSQISTGNFPGSFNYDYITGNGVCPNDTAIVVVNIGTCDFLNVDETLFEGVEVYPNPTKGTIFISSDVSEAFDYVVTDAKGRVIAQKEGAVNASEITEINLSTAETGVYFIRLSNEQTMKTYRVVVQP